MTRSGLSVAALDLLLCFLVLLLLSFFAALYDAERGLGDLDFSLLQDAIPSSEDVPGATRAADFVALRLRSDEIEAWHYDHGSSQDLGRFQSVSAFADTDIATPGRVIVLFEDKASPLLGDLVRFLTGEDVRVGIARVTPD